MTIRIVVRIHNMPRDVRKRNATQGVCQGLLAQMSEISHQILHSACGSVQDDKEYDFVQDDNEYGSGEMQRYGSLNFRVWLGTTWLCKGYSCG